MVVSAAPPPMVDALRRVRRRRSGTRLWTCRAGRAGTCIRSEALHRVLTFGRLAAARAGARPYHRLGKGRQSRMQRGEAKDGAFRLQLAKCESFSGGNSRGASPAVSAIGFQDV